MGKMEKRTCEICGKPYHPWNHTQKTCSHECGRELSRRRQREWYMNNKDKHRESNRKWARNNREKVNRIRKEWRMKHKEKTTDLLFEAYSEYLKENVK